MNQKEFLETVLPFKDKVFRLAKRLLVSSDEAEDATQELYLKLWRNKNKIEQYDNVEAYAMMMTKNYCLDQLKSKRASNLTLVHSNYKDESSREEENLEYKDGADILKRMMNDLPAKQRMIIQLRDVENYEFQEIGKIMNMEPTAIRVALSRARKTLREKFIKKQNYGIG
ncbi:RNA polymerase sigma factor [Lutimonas saemankumensis]|uniref:RNA polymerase sigma factor n=1 Tax=Lutimonas saemankumensis TaxID=483016 RepID=UPI001CD26603|nr:RNA polymerase sigma factor [Lutimonas saemankumensis]MCA0931836.1 RNA polymerase sigma factor [Lutimonas saemankumensis]